VQAVRRGSQFAVKKDTRDLDKNRKSHSSTQNSTWDLVPLVEVVVKRNACLPCCSAVFISRPGGFKRLSFPRRLTILPRLGRDPPEHRQVVIGVFFVTLHPIQPSHPKSQCLDSHVIHHRLFRTTGDSMKPD
jgi:hypothetical protein